MHIDRCIYINAPSKIVLHTNNQRPKHGAHDPIQCPNAIVLAVTQNGANQTTYLHLHSGVTSVSICMQRPGGCGVQGADTTQDQDWFAVVVTNVSVWVARVGTATSHSEQLSQGTLTIQVCYK